MLRTHLTRSLTCAAPQVSKTPGGREEKLAHPPQAGGEGNICRVGAT